MHDSFNLSASLPDQPKAFMTVSSPLPTSLKSGYHIPASMSDAHPSAGPSQPAVRGSSLTPQEDSPVQDAEMTGAPTQQASDPGPQEGSACHGILDGAGLETHPSGQHAGVLAQQSSLSSLQLFTQHKPADPPSSIQEQASDGTPLFKDNPTQIADKQMAAQQPHRSSAPAGLGMPSGHPPPVTAAISLSSSAEDSLAMANALKVVTALVTDLDPFGAESLQRSNGICADCHACNPSTPCSHESHQQQEQQQQSPRAEAPCRGVQTHQTTDATMHEDDDSPEGSPTSITQVDDDIPEGHSLLSPCGHKIQHGATLAAKDKLAPDATGLQGETNFNSASSNDCLVLDTCPQQQHQRSLEIGSPAAGISLKHHVHAMYTPPGNGDQLACDASPHTDEPANTLASTIDTRLDEVAEPAGIQADQSSCSELISALQQQNSEVQDVVACSSPPEAHSALDCRPNQMSDQPAAEKHRLKISTLQALPGPQAVEQHAESSTQVVLYKPPILQHEAEAANEDVMNHQLVCPQAGSHPAGACGGQLEPSLQTSHSTDASAAVSSDPGGSTGNALQTGKSEARATGRDSASPEAGDASARVKAPISSAALHTSTPKCTVEQPRQTPLNHGQMRADVHQQHPPPASLNMRGGAVAIGMLSEAQGDTTESLPDDSDQAARPAGCSAAHVVELAERATGSGPAAAGTLCSQMLTTLQADLPTAAYGANTSRPEICQQPTPDTPVDPGVRSRFLHGLNADLSSDLPTPVPARLSQGPCKAASISHTISLLRETELVKPKPKPTNASSAIPTHIHAQMPLSIPHACSGLVTGNQAADTAVPQFQQAKPMQATGNEHTSSAEPGPSKTIVDYSGHKEHSSRDGASNLRQASCIATKPAAPAEAETGAIMPSMPAGGHSITRSETDTDGRQAIRPALIAAPCSAAVAQADQQLGSADSATAAQHKSSLKSPSGSQVLPQKRASTESSDISKKLCGRQLVRSSKSPQHDAAPVMDTVPVSREHVGKSSAGPRMPGLRSSPRPAGFPYVPGAVAFSPALPPGDPQEVAAKAPWHTALQVTAPSGSRRPVQRLTVRPPDAPQVRASDDLGYMFVPSSALPEIDPREAAAKALWHKDRQARPHAAPTCSSALVSPHPRINPTEAAAGACAYPAAISTSLAAQDPQHQQHQVPSLHPHWNPHPRPPRPVFPPPRPVSSPHPMAPPYPPPRSFPPPHCVPPPRSVRHVLLGPSPPIDPTTSSPARTFSTTSSPHASWSSSVTASTTMATTSSCSSFRPPPYRPFSSPSSLCRANIPSLMWLRPTAPLSNNCPVTA